MTLGASIDLGQLTDTSTSQPAHNGNGEAPHGNGDAPRGNGDAPRGNGDAPHGVTAAQLRRFIKSRPYVPMHELRRRFELNGDADDVFPIRTSDGIVYLGLPERESHLIGDLVRQGEVGLELCRDPHSPMVVGVFAMRPISRT